MADIEKTIKELKDGLDFKIFDNTCVLLEVSTVSDALELLKEQPKWIPVSEGLPEEHDTIFAKLKGTDKWRSAMFEKMSDDVRIVGVFSDGTRRVSHSHTVDGKWECEKSPVKRTVTHWMPNHAMPKAGEQE